MSLDSNPAVQFLNNADVGVQYLQETVLFLFTLSVVRGAGAKKNLVSTLGTSFLRAFGDISITLSLGLGTMPGAVFKNLDATMQNLLIAVFWAWYVDSHIPAEVRSFWNWAQDVAYAVIKGNNAFIGYSTAASALPGSWWAPLFGAYLGVNGARLLEKGMSAARKTSWDNDDLLAVVSGLFLWFFTTQLSVGVATSRAVLVLWAYSNNHINWQSKVNGIFHSGLSAMKRR